MPEAVIVSHVGIETSHVCYKLTPFLGCHTCFIRRGILKKLEILALEVELEEDEEGWRLVRDLVEDHLCTRPRGLVKEVGVVLLLLGQ